MASFCYSTKRARDEDIRVAAGEPVPAESFVLRALSSCARALPADAQEWDVSGLLADGQPFSREAVACWLACGYSHIYGAAAEMDAGSISQLSTVAGLTQVLAFADAVGSFEGICKAACSQLQQFVVQLPEQTLELPVTDDSYRFSSNARQLMQFSMHGRDYIGSPFSSAEQFCDVQQQVAKQTAALLRLAHVLRLQPLLDVLHQFILLNACPQSPRFKSAVLTGCAGLVFSDAVLEAALGSSTLSREAYISSVLLQPCSLTPDSVGHGSLLKPLGPPTFRADRNLLMFDAELLRDFAGGRAGDTVAVVLDLWGSACDEGTIMLKAPDGSTVLLPVQLLLGRSLPDATALEAFLKAGTAE